jgi:hypothetical protein
MTLRIDPAVAARITELTCGGNKLIPLKRQLYDFSDQLVLQRGFSVDKQHDIRYLKPQF